MGETSPVLFRKLEKYALILTKNLLPTVIYGLNFSFKVQFLRVSRRKTGDISQWDLSFSCCRWLFIEVPWFQEDPWLRARYKRLRSLKIDKNDFNKNFWTFLLFEISVRKRSRMTVGWNLKQRSKKKMDLLKATKFQPLQSQGKNMLHGTGCCHGVTSGWWLSWVG